MTVINIEYIKIELNDGLNQNYRSGNPAEYLRVSNKNAFLPSSELSKPEKIETRNTSCIMNDKMYSFLVSVAKTIPFFENLYDNPFGNIKLLELEFIYTRPLSFNSIENIENFSTINMLQCDVNGKHKIDKIDYTAHGVNCFVKINEVLLRYQNDNIIFQIYYAMSFHFDEEKCIFQNGYFEVTLNGSIEEMFENYNSSNEYTYFVIDKSNAACNPIKTLQEAFDEHINDFIIRARAQVIREMKKMADDFCNKIKSPMLKKFVLIKLGETNLKE